MTDLRSAPAPEPRARLARAWITVAVGALATSGVLALVVVAARLPGIAGLIEDTGFARRALVVHVDLGVLAWFAALPVVAVQLHLLARGMAGVTAVARLGLALAAAGVVGIACGLALPSELAHTVNYVPLVDHPFYFSALGCLFTGAGLGYLEAFWAGRRRGRGFTGEAVAVPGAPVLPPAVAGTLAASRTGLALGGAYYLLALASVAASTALLPPGIEAPARFEVTMWAGGHALQFANLAFALVAWTVLAAWGSGRTLAPTWPARACWIALAVPMPAIVWLVAQGPVSALHRAGFTFLMRWTMFPPALAYLALFLLPALLGWRARRAAHGAEPGRPPAMPGAANRAGLVALGASVFLMLLGFVYGAAIEGSDLRVPGHYHAAIGAVTLAFMALALLALDPAGGRARTVAWVYGAGQTVFATGLVLAGSYGLGRKTYGVEQQLANAGQVAGAWVMGVGGALAFTGGAIWAVAVLRRLYRARAAIS